MSPSTQELLNGFALQEEEEEEEEETPLVREKRRLALSRAITLLESSKVSDQQQASLLLTSLLENNNNNNNTFRLGMTGAPGAGKSTLLECLGMHMLQQEQEQPDTKLAVLCVDPSSTKTGGSILGDKTRMVELAKHERAFVRPSSNRGVLGGLSLATHQVVSVCHAAGYHHVWLETVGVGQAEVAVEQNADMVVLVVPPGGGDELQGVKKGIVEIADLIVVTKADGNLTQAAIQTAAEYQSAVRYQQQQQRHHNRAWTTTPVLLTSAMTGEGIPELWQEIQRFQSLVMKNDDDDDDDDGYWKSKRTSQSVHWMWQNVQDLIQQELKHQQQHNPHLQETTQRMEKELAEGRITPRAAAAIVLDCFRQGKPY